MARSPGEILADLGRAFPRQKISGETFAVYLRHLSDLPADVLDVTVAELCRTCEFFPTIRAIREAAAERVLALPTEEQALAQVEARVGWGRVHDQPGDPPAVHDLVRQALTHVGGYYAFRTSAEPAVVRGQFLRLYRDLRSTALRETQVGDVVAALPSAARAQLSA